MTTPVFHCLGRVLAVPGDGPARVQRLDASGLVVHPSSALPWRYTPAVGDLLQLLGQGERVWIVGVHSGRGRSELAFRGNVQLHAAGALQLGGDGGVRVRAPRIELTTDELHSEAAAAVLRASSLDSSAERLDERAGRCERVVEGDDRTTAGTHRTQAAVAVTIDGDLLRLG